jgi:hypothetical protein
VAALGMVGGAAASSYWLVTSFLLLRLDEIWLAFVFGDLWPIVRETIQVLLVTVAIALIVTLTLLVLAALAANAVVLGPVRHVLFGLTRTYAAGPGAPAWAGTAPDDHVLRLPIPAELTTLSFDRNAQGVDDAIARAIADAAAVTCRGLDVVLERPRIRGPARPQSPQATAAEATGTPAASGSGASALAIRMSLVAGGLGVSIFLVSLVAPKPEWYRYDTNVRICAHALETPDSPCDEPTRGSMVATVLFGPPRRAGRRARRWPSVTRSSSRRPRSRTRHRDGSSTCRSTRRSCAERATAS